MANAPFTLSMACTFGPKPCLAAQLVRSASGLQLEWELTLDNGEDWMQRSLTMKLCRWEIQFDWVNGKLKLDALPDLTAGKFLVLRSRDGDLLLSLEWSVAVGLFEALSLRVEQAVMLNMI